jgi:hypothetical protein
VCEHERVDIHHSEPSGDRKLGGAECSGSALTGPAAIANSAEPSSRVAFAVCGRW